MKFRKKPVVIEAIQWTGGNWVEISNFVGGSGVFVDGNLHLTTLENKNNTFEASIGDWIIKGVKGEFYPCKPDIFEATYEPVV